MASDKLIPPLVIVLVLDKLTPVKLLTEDSITTLFEFVSVTLFAPEATKLLSPPTILLL